MSSTVERAPSMRDFAGLSGPASGPFSEWVRARHADGESRPAWCFVSRGRDSSVVARCGFWATPHEPEVGRMFGLRWRPSVSTSSRVEFVRECVSAVREDGLERLEARVYSSQEEHEQLLACLAAAGFTEQQQKVRLERAGDVRPPRSPGRVSFRSLESAGRVAFVDAIERVTHDTLDRLDEREARELGSRAAAELTFDLLSDMHREPGWWELAFNGDGTMVGLVVPQVLGAGVGVINYIGVVPERRGTGLVDDLLARGTWRASHGTERIVAETDERNRPMRDALLRHGYVEQSRMWHLSLA